MRKVARDEVERIADLARLDFGQEELEAFRESFQGILDYFAHLEQVDTDKVEPTYHALSGQEASPLQPDEEGGSLDVELVLGQAPDSQEGHFRVPKVIE